MRRTKDIRYSHCPYCHKPPKVAYGIARGFAYCNGGLLFNKHEMIFAESRGSCETDVEMKLIENWSQTVIKAILDRRGKKANG